MKNLLPVLVLLLVGLIVFAFWPEVSAGKAPAPATATPNPQSSGELVESSATEQSVTARQQIDTVSDTPSSSADSALAVLRGRCVDASGQPIAGVRAAVGGREANAKRMAQHRETHGEVQWTDPEPQITGADGRFEFAFVPPPPYRFDLDLQGPGLVSLTGDWHELPPGTVKDFGDLQMVGGCRISGRLEDTKARPLPDRVQISIDQHNLQGRDKMSEMSHRSYLSCAVQSDGSFTFRAIARPGRYRLRVGREEIIAPKPFVVPSHQAEWFVKIVVASYADTPTIEGIVVDAAGKPIRRAQIEVRPRRGSTGFGDSSRRDGTFKIRQENLDTGEPVRLTLVHEGFEILESKPIEWGEKDARIVLQRGLDLRIQVTRGDIGKPLEDYSVIVMPVPGKWKRSSSAGRRPRNRGHHEGGITVIRGLRRGPYLVLVDPVNGPYLHSQFHPVMIGAGLPRQLDVVLHRGAQRTVRVESTRGSPIAGTLVDLLQPMGPIKVGFETWVFELHSGSSSSGSDQALFRGRSKTNKAGEITFVAPPGADYILRAHGPGHRPQVRSGVTFAPDLPTEVLQVPVGARVFGKVAPPELLQKLFAVSAELTGDRTLVGFRLRCRQGRRFERFPAGHSKGFRIHPDGSYEITGIPPGTWSLLLHWAHNEHEAIAELADLHEGENRELNHDLPALIPATIKASVSLNGKPAAGQILTLHTDAAEDSKWRNFNLDDQGRLDATVTPASYKVTLQLKTGRRKSVMIPHDQRLVVSPGQATEPALAFHVGEVNIVVLGHDDKPRRGVTIYALSDGMQWATDLPLTDASGKSATKARLGSIQFHVLPKHLLNDKARREFNEANRGNPNAWIQQRIQLGAAVIVAGAEKAIRLRLPESAGY